MKSFWRSCWTALFKTRGRRLLLLALLLVGLSFGGCATVLVLWTMPVFRGRLTTVLNPEATGGLIYFHDSVREVPWSMHVIKLSRTARDFELHTTLGRGDHLGMGRISDQVKLLPPAWGRPIAAVNGDLFNNHPDYPGDPEGLQIKHGELVSGPSPTRACFWLDAQGHPQRGDVAAQFAVTWPDGSTSAFGLNEARPADAAVLYTAALGNATRTRGGLDLVLEPDPPAAALPLRIGQTFSARIAALNPAGNTPLTNGLLVLSLGPEHLARLPAPTVGTVLRLSTATAPDLTGVPTAIGGGPTLVAGGKAREWSGLCLRHPRTALGWNDQAIFLVVVDGRQLGLSAGMTFPELADYLVKLGCQEAIGLDGGGSATCWAYGTVANSPSQGHERPSANALVVVKKAPAKPAPAPR